MRPPSFNAALVRKYDGFGPRYTSYPTADRFDSTFTAEHYVQALHARNELRPTQPLSLYVHLPFCNTVCYYCACNKIITANRQRSARYVTYLQREIAMIGALLEGDAPVAQLHWGGGTPTFLSHEEMRTLMDALRAQFRFALDSELSIEVDPRKADAETIALLAELGFNRISVGVQDFDPEVQHAVNRIQSEAVTRAVIDAARSTGFVSINVDLIYGLPRQTVAGFSITLDKVLAAAPDRIALYSYAHLPHVFKTQRQIIPIEVPSGESKLAILQLAIDRLTAAGYVYIGMDHFARPGDELAVAQRQRKLHRNFQGYSTRPDCDLLAFGISAIGKVGDAYVQNEKTLDRYYKRLDAAALPVLRGITATRDDVRRRRVIQSLMCDFALRYAEFDDEALAFSERFAPELAALRPLAADGLITMTDESLHVTPAGRLLVRAIAMQFDRRLRESRNAATHSRIV